MRLKILFGTLILVGSLALGALLVMQVAATLLPDQWLVELLFYAVAGTVWVYPAAKLTGWMQR